MSASTPSEAMQRGKFSSQLSNGTQELAVGSASGAVITSASCYSINHPPNAVLESNASTFWMTTGIFPQEIVLQLAESSTIKSVELIATGLRNIELSKCDGQQANTWERVSVSEADDADGEIQRLSMQVPSRLSANFLRIKVR